MKLFILFATAVGAAIGGWWVTTHHPDLVNKIENFINKGELHTLEIRFGAQELMEAHKRELLKDKRHEYLKPALKFYPYLLMEVKYCLSDRLTGEGVILWDLRDGEMVIQTKDWEKTHGFGDCLSSHATKEEFKILNILARKGGTVDRESLSKTLRTENEILDSLIDSCRRKNLIVQAGNSYRLHLQRPKFNILPETRLDKKLVTQPVKRAARLSTRYSPQHIIHVAHAAFGNHFSMSALPTTSSWKSTFHRPFSFFK